MNYSQVGSGSYYMKNMKMSAVLHFFLMISSLLAISSKLAAQEPFLSQRFMVYYSVVLLNLGVYAVIWQQLIKRMPLVTAYANKAVGTIWGLVWAKVFFGEEITKSRVVGVMIIIIGIILVVTNQEDNKYD